jgi:hypothetical protein
VVEGEGVRVTVAERVTLAAVAAIEAEVQRLNAGPVLRQLTIKINLHPYKDKAYIDYQGSEVEV